MDLTAYDYILINSSGGKDSQAMLDYVVEMAIDQGVKNRLLVAHADLGRVEWKGTRELAERQSAHYGLRFEAVKRPQGDLLAHVEQRGMWPSPAQRYCTSDHKRGQIQKIVTQLSKENPGRHLRILSCMGLRAEESSARAKLEEMTPNLRYSNTKRTVDTWLPIHNWKEGEVWERIRQSGVEHHPSYDIGMPRLSCIFCIYAPKNALVLAGKHNRELLEEYVAVEERIGHTFRQDVTMAQVKAAVDAGGDTGELSGKWNM